MSAQPDPKQPIPKSATDQPFELGPLVHIVIVPGSYATCHIFFRQEDADTEAERWESDGGKVERYSTILLYRKGDMVYHAYEHKLSELTTCPIFSDKGHRCELRVKHDGDHSWKEYDEKKDGPFIGNG